MPPPSNFLDRKTGKTRMELQSKSGSFLGVPTKIVNSGKGNSFLFPSPTLLLHATIKSLPAS
ncbi:hypothetical protein DLM75_20430 [Leptospira stimsonii]|uniref:Uncharacterized protein n=1 Tax=Leptospira stimsonii TaxID=2202203 RepID=A0A396YQQ7_9LEPT|nr:hypothetical protein DLM75_20430 [Leptospira stimsonii]